jgi:molybdenum storage protein
MPTFKKLYENKIRFSVLTNLMIRRYDIDNKLKGETLVRKGLMKKHAGAFQLKIVPDLNVVKIGGHGIIDFGREVVLPLMEEIGELSKKHKMLIVTGGGARVRHILDVGIDLGMPTGVLAELAGKISEQNAVIVSLLLTKWGGTRVKTGDLLD